MINNLKTILCVLGIAFLSGSWAADGSSSAGGDVVKIEAFMKKMFDKPNAKLTAEPIVVDSNYAIASWVQGHTGGRALLTKKDGQWSILTCSGDGLLQLKALKLAGVPDSVAVNLIGQISLKESKLPKEKRKMFSLFRAESFAH